MRIFRNTEQKVEIKALPAMTEINSLQLFRERVISERGTQVTSFKLSSRRKMYLFKKKKKSHKQTPTSPHSLYVPKEQHYLIATFCPFFLFFSLKSFREAELLTKLPTYGKNRWISAFIKHWNLKRHKTFQKIKNKTKQRKTPHTVISEGVYPVHYYADFTNISLIKEKAAL